MIKNICIVGYGSIGKRHHKILKKILGSAVKFDIVDLDTDLKIEDCINKEYDILVICTPTSSHIDILSKFKKINQLVFVEKPIDSSIEKAKKLKNNNIKTKVHVGCNLRFTNAYSELKQVINDALYINVNSMSYLPTWRNLSDYKVNYSSNKSMGGGVVYDFIHEPDYIYSLLGKPSQYQTCEKRLFGNITVDSADTASILWEYENKIININLSYGSKKYIRNVNCLLLSGEMKTIEFTPNDISESYEKQWLHILESGPCNTFDSALGLLEILDG